MLTQPSEVLSGTPALSALSGKSIVYFSKMFQAIPHLVPVQRHIGGTFVTNRSSTLQAISRHYADVPALRYRSKLKWLSPAYHQFRHADLVITGSSYRDILASHKGLKALTFHGTYMAFGRKALADCAHFDLLCVTGPRMKQMIGRHLQDFSLHCVDTGFLPFTDFPEQSVAQRLEVCERLGLDAQRRTIVYTPSRKAIGSWDLLADALIDQLSAEFNLVMRPHPSQSLTPRLDDRQSFARVTAHAAQFPHVRVDLGQFHLPELQSIADLMITDANSPAEESLFYDVPQLFVETERFSQDSLRDILDREEIHADDRDQVLGLYDCGKRLRAVISSDLRAAVEQAIAASNQFHTAREAYFSWVFGQRDRQAPARVGAALGALLTR